MKATVYSPSCLSERIKFLFAIDLKQAGGGGSIFGETVKAEVSVLMEEMIEFVLSGVSANQIISLPMSTLAPCRAVRANLQTRPLIFVSVPLFFHPSFFIACG